MNRLAALMLILATAASGQLTYSLAFTRELNNYGRVDTGLPQLAGATNYTLEMWVRPTGLGAAGSDLTDHSLFSFIDGSTDWRFGFHDQILNLRVQDQNIMWSAPEVTNDTWQHIAVVVEDTLVIAYIDGIHAGL